MSVQLGINGFGRIGRLLFRAAVANPQKFRVTAINDLNEIPYLIYLLKYDSAHGKLPTTIQVTAAYASKAGSSTQEIQISKILHKESWHTY